MAKGGFSHAPMEETQSLTKIPGVEVQEEQKRCVEFPGPRKVKAVIERHPAMVGQNHPNRYLPCQNGTPKNSQTCWRWKGRVAPPPDWHRQPTPEPTPPLHKTQAAPPSDNEGSERSQINNLPLGYVYSHAPLSSTQWFNCDAYHNDCQHIADYNPDMLTDEGTSTGYYTICCVVMPLIFILQTSAAYWANMQVRTSIDRKERDFECNILYNQLTL